MKLNFQFYSQVVLIFGVFGAMRIDELTNLQLDHITQLGTLLEIQVPKTKTMRRSFVIAEDCVNYVKQYQALRPEEVPTNRFFLNYQVGKCTSQVIGKNKFSTMPKQIAKFLRLPNFESYSGQTFRRSTATILIDKGVNLETLKRHGGWKSSDVAEGYIAESFENRKQIGIMINSSLNFPRVKNETLDSEDPLGENTNSSFNFTTVKPETLDSEEPSEENTNSSFNCTTIKTETLDIDEPPPERNMTNSSLNFPPVRNKTLDSEGPSWAKIYRIDDSNVEISVSPETSNQQHSIHLHNCVVTINYNVPSK